MNERLTNRLLPETREALRLALRVAGKEPRVTRVDQLPDQVKGMLVRPRSPGQGYEIRVAKGQERFLDHIVAHEVGHLLRLHQVPEAERLMPAVTENSRRAAAERVVPQAFERLGPAFGVNQMAQLFNIWYGGLASQLSSFPADLRIEAWIHQRFPGLRGAQRKSLVEEVSRALPSFMPQVVAFTPEVVYQPTMAMNAAQAIQVAELYGLPHFLEPFARFGFVEPGQELLQLAMEPQDRGHRSDMEAINRWAEKLGLVGWFEWRPYERTC